MAGFRLRVQLVSQTNALISIQIVDNGENLGINRQWIIYPEHRLVLKMSISG